MAFSSYLAAKINEHFPSNPEKEASPTAEPEALYVALNTVKDPSFVRVEAGAEMRKRSFFFCRRRATDKR